MSYNDFELKCECGATIFNIFKNASCDNCKHNGYIDLDDESRYSYGTSNKGIPRTEVSDEGECELGQAFGEGCYRHLCAVCGKTRDHLPLIDY
jgi:hypothetical protein